MGKQKASPNGLAKRVASLGVTRSLPLRKVETAPVLQGFDVSSMAYFNGDTFFVNLLASLYRG
ncbi:hypothetical protein FC75_GL002282 [Lacticaseibacillus camelliae DSM 22697 = JCM 13995]|uniref:Uncharacterized protein n=1 Tax=Lacticaseibacillus camelliae DSM 22697 = JCM 13995 TaxID=1423730 RepID=A0A0R2EYF8_9LACO|nr:hypothetical protein FC75_GL002282 [Lacticaseibacillus camelliae DSM 22697 = JCM 13995]